MEKYKVELRNDEDQIKEAKRQMDFIGEIRKEVEKIEKQIGRPLFSHIKTFGCQMNLEIPTTCS